MSSTVITSIHNPALDVETQDEVNTYLLKLKELSDSDFCIEFNNVLAAKHNIKMMPSAIHNSSERQLLISSMNDRAAYICILTVGRDKVLNYGNGDSRAFIQLLEDLDAQVTKRNLDSEMHGRAMLQLIHDNL